MTGSVEGAFVGLAVANHRGRIVCEVNVVGQDAADVVVPLLYHLGKPGECLGRSNLVITALVAWHTVHVDVSAVLADAVDVIVLVLLVERCVVGEAIDSGVGCAVAMQTGEAIDGAVR